MKIILYLTLQLGMTYDSLSEVHCRPLEMRHQLTNVIEADEPIYLNQVHDKFKCTHHGTHPLLNAPMWLAPVPTTIVSHAVCRESGQLLRYNCDDDIFNIVNPIL